MAREYIVSDDNQTVAGATSLIAINPAAASGGFEVIRAWASQRANATSAQVGINIGNKATAFSTLTSATPKKTKQGDPISTITGGTAGAAGTAGTNASVEGAGTHSIMIPDNFNALNGWLWVATPQEVLAFSPYAALAYALKFSAAPGTLTGWSFGTVYRELG